MRVHETKLPGVLIIELAVHMDPRGFFTETFSERRYAEAGVPVRFVQDNVSRSSRSTLRGLHLQAPPHAQGKLVSVLEGEVFDVVVDVRPGSATFGQWVAETLSLRNGKQIYVPPGFAHGFCVLSDTALFTYKCSDYYAPSSELAVRWNDPEIGIDWPLAEPLLSPRDASAMLLRELPARLRQTSSSP